MEVKGSGSRPRLAVLVGVVGLQHRCRSHHVLDRALEQIPDVHRYGAAILDPDRSDSAGRAQGLLVHVRGLREYGMKARFSVGVAVTEDVRQAIVAATQ